MIIVKFEDTQEVTLLPLGVEKVKGWEVIS